MPTPSLSVEIHPVNFPEIGDILLGNGNRLVSIGNGAFLLGNGNDIFLIMWRGDSPTARKMSIPMKFQSNIDSLKIVIINNTLENYKSIVSIAYITGEILLLNLNYNEETRDYSFTSPKILPPTPGYHHIYMELIEKDEELNNSFIIMSLTSPETGEIQIYPIYIDIKGIRVEKMKHWCTKTEPLASFADGIVSKDGKNPEIIVGRALAITRNNLAASVTRGKDSDPAIGTDFYNIEDRYFDEEQSVGEIIKTSSETGDFLTAVTCSIRGLRKLLQIKYTYKETEDNKDELILKPPKFIKFNDLIKDEKRSLKGRASILEISKVIKLSGDGKDITESLLVASCGLGEVSITNVPFVGPYSTTIARIKGVPVGCALESAISHKHDSPSPNSSDARAEEKIKPRTEWKICVATDEGGCFLGTVTME